MPDDAAKPPPPPTPDGAEGRVYFPELDGLRFVAFALVYLTMQAPKEYVGFVVLGGMMTAFWLNVLWSMGAQLYYDRDAGNLELFILAPAPLSCSPSSTSSTIPTK